MTFGSLFAGIGGFDLGLERAGMECKWQVEKDAFCQKVLAKHWPNVKKYEDIYNVKKPEPVDLICGGFPCQPVSYAGQRKGEQDERWLWPEFFRIVCMVRPEYVLLENVPGLLSSGFGCVLGDLAKIGYDAEWQVLSAKNFGAPHIRERIFVVAYPCSISSSLRIFNRNSYKKSKRNYNKKKWCEDRKFIKMGTKIDRRISENKTWFPEPNVDRMVDGVPSELDRLRSLGNAVVPQIVQILGEIIIKTHNQGLHTDHNSVALHCGR